MDLFRGNTKWTELEKLAMKPLVLQCVSHCRPPIKEEVEELKKKNLCLKKLDWLKIKHRVWAMAQQKKRREIEC